MDNQGKSYELKKCIWVQNLLHELVLKYLPHSKPIFSFEHSSNHFNKIKSGRQCYWILVQQIKLKDGTILNLSYMCLTASSAQNHSQANTAFLTVAYLQFFRGERVAQGIVGPCSVALRVPEPVSCFITVFWSPFWWKIAIRVILAYAYYTFKNPYKNNFYVWK